MCQHWTVTETSPHSILKFHCDLSSQQMSCCKLEQNLGTGKKIWAAEDQAEEKNSAAVLITSTVAFQVPIHAIFLVVLVFVGQPQALTLWVGVLLSLQPSLSNRNDTNNYSPYHSSCGSRSNLSRLEMCFFF